MFAIFILEVLNGGLLLLFIYSLTNSKTLFVKLLFKIILPDTAHILDNEALIKPKPQDCPKVCNLVVAKQTEIAFVEIFVSQFVNILLLWLYLLSTVVTFLIRYLSNNKHNGRPGQSDSGGPFGFLVRPSFTSFMKSTAA